MRAALPCCAGVCPAPHGRYGTDMNAPAPDGPTAADDRWLFALGLRLLAVACLASMSMLVKLSSEAGVRLPEIMFWRQLCAMPVVLVWVLAGPGLSSLRTTRLRSHAARSLMGTAGMVLTFGASILLPLAEAATLSFAVPIFATILSALVLKEHVGIHRWSAVIIGFIGVLIVTQPGSAHIPLFGGAVGIGAALAVAIISLQLRDLGRTEAPPTTVFWFSALSSLLLLALHLLPIPGRLGALLSWSPDPHTIHQWMLLILLGVLGGIGQIALTASLKHAPVSMVVGMDYTALIWSTLYGALIWHVLPAPSTWAGAPLIVGSGIYIVWRERIRQRPRPIAQATSTE